MNIKTVTVIGATGTMGANVAGIFASFGEAKVFCIARNYERVKETIPRIVKSVRADAIAGNLIPADFSMLEQCVSQSDLVFESIAEDAELKAKIARAIASALRDNAISCTGSSGLSITEMAKCYSERQRTHFFGVHMFNPPYNMSLCELIPTVYSDKRITLDFSEYLKNKLFRTVVEVKDAPAFLGNRIGFQLINEALQYAEKYKDNGGIDYIDAILGTFTGRAMPPLITCDFVGLDVHKAIVDNIYSHVSDYVHETFILPSFVNKLISEGKLGRKSNVGLYQSIRYDSGLRRLTVFDINSGYYRDVLPYAFPFAEKMKKHFFSGNYQLSFIRLVNNHSQEAEICLSFLLKYIIYSLYTAKEVGYSVEAADDVMATGFNWCPPLALYQAISTAADLPALLRERLPEICKKVDVDFLLADVKPSKYDYRPYFRSGRKI